MSVLEIVGSILLFVSSVLLVIVVLAQQGRSAYLGGAIAGGAAESFLGKAKAKTVDAILSRYTKILAIAFIVLAVIVNIGVMLLKHSS